MCLSNYVEFYSWWYKCQCIVSGNDCADKVKSHHLKSMMTQFIDSYICHQVSMSWHTEVWTNPCHVKILGVFKGYFLSEIICISNKIIFQYIAVSFIIDQSKVQGVIGAIFGWCTLGNKPLPVTSYIICCVIIPERKRPDATWWYSYTIYLLSLISKLAGQQCGTKRFLKQ